MNKLKKKTNKKKKTTTFEDIVREFIFPSLDFTRLSPYSQEVTNTRTPF